MPEYIWQGIDLSGSHKQGTLVAENSETLRDLLLDSGIALLSYHEGSYSPLSRRPLESLSLRSASPAVFFEYLGHLLESGVPLLRSLELVVAQVTDKSMATTLGAVILCVKKGKPFSVALQEFPLVFSPLVIQLVTVGEKTGKLALALSYLNTHFKAEKAFKKTLKQAAIFPLFTMIFAIIIVVCILLFIIPQFESFFSSTSKPLPSFTRWIIATSSWIRSSVGILSIVGALASIIGAFAMTPRIVFQRIAYKIPWIGDILITVNLINVLRMLSLFLKAGVPLKQALETISFAVKNRYYKKKLLDVTQAIVDGHALIDQLPRLAPVNDVELLTTFVSLGEQTGQLDAMLARVAFIFEERLKRQISIFTLFFQPTLMVIVGLIIAGLMAAVYLPIFNLSYAIS